MVKRQGCSWICCCVVKIIVGMFLVVLLLIFLLFVVLVFCLLSAFLGGFMIWIQMVEKYLKNDDKKVKDEG